ncbi:MAG: DegT/DnrJ/EryC1/StrS family aminotransferase [Arenicellales bacterium]|nr:DegT/DnrJ/EryC1/StrS family aminotransferase [Arenicellales bacterium]
MRNWLLDGSLIVTSCMDTGAKPVPVWLEVALSQGHRFWVYVGQLQSMRTDLIRKLTESGADQPEATAMSRLASSLSRCQWLAALAEDGDVLAEADLIGAQLRKAAARLGGNSCILTDDPQRIAQGKPFCTVARLQELSASSGGIAFIDLASQQDRIRPALESALHRVLHHGRYIQGPEIDALEKRLADYVGVEHCVGVSSGTDALLIALMALGIGPDDEIITTAFSFAATAEAVLLLGARPVYVDIDPVTFNIDVSLIEEKINARTRAILPVGLYGQCPDFPAMRLVARQHGLALIEDAAQSFGATQDGMRSGNLGTIGATSFFPAKPLGAYGDAGACFTNDADLMTRLRELRDHGQSRRYHHVRLGINARMASIQAAVLLQKLEIFDDELVMRQRAAKCYQTLLEGSADPVGMTLPVVAPGNTSSWAQYTVQVGCRDQVQAALLQRGVPTAVHYPSPIPMQPAMLDSSGQYPVSARSAQSVLSLPMHPYLNSTTQQRIAEQLIQAVKETIA